MKDRVRYIDTFCNGSMHEQFNASLLLMLSLIYEQVIYQAHISSSEKVLQLIENRDRDNIRLRKVFVWNGNGRWDNLIKIVISAFQNIRILLFSRKTDILIFNYNNLFSLQIFNSLNKILRRRVVIFCHGELELILPTPFGAGLLHKLLASKARKFFANPKIVISKTLYFAVMGNSIRDNLSKIITPLQAQQLLSINHAYIFDSNSEPKTDRSDSTLRIGTVGIFNEIKGADSLIELAKILDVNSRADIELSVTGKIFYDVDKLEQVGVNLPQNKGRQPLSRNEFNSRIDKLDYLLFLYPVNSYKLIASGAVMDSIARCRPIISLSNEYYAYLFERFGVMGVLVDDLEQIAAQIELICKSRTTNNFDFKSLQEKFSPDSIKNELFAELKRIDFIR